MTRPLTTNEARVLTETIEQRLENLKAYSLLLHATDAEVESYHATINTLTDTLSALGLKDAA